MAPHTDDLRIRRIDALVPPAQLIAELPCSETASETVDGSRRALHRSHCGQDARLAGVVGACVSHERAAAVGVHAGPQAMQVLGSRKITHIGRRMRRA